MQIFSVSLVQIPKTEKLSRDLQYSVLTKRLVGKNISKMIYFASGEK